MFKYFLAKKLQSLDRGFTLIELLVVTLIVGVLSAMSYPGLVAQVGKARETEASSNLGLLGRSQLNFHFETQTFATDINTLGQTNLSLSPYYDFPDPSIANQTIVKHQAIAKAPYDVSSRNFSIGVYFDSAAGAFRTVLCRAQFPTSSVIAPDVASDSCSNNGVKIQ